MPSLWHNAWQNRFADREVVHARLPGGSQARRADAMGCGGRVVIEVQHSYIKRDEVDARGRDYGLHGKRVVWVIDGDEGVRVERLGVSDTCLLVFEWRCAWKYASFTGAADVFVCHGGAVFQVPADKCSQPPRLDLPGRRRGAVVGCKALHVHRPGGPRCNAEASDPRVAGLG